MVTHLPALITFPADAWEAYPSGMPDKTPLGASCRSCCWAPLIQAAASYIGATHVGGSIYGNVKYISAPRQRTASGRSMVYLGLYFRADHHEALIWNHAGLVPARPTTGRAIPTSLHLCYSDRTAD